MSNYALPKSHQDVGSPHHTKMEDVYTDSRQLMEKSLVETDSEVAQIMVCSGSLFELFGMLIGSRRGKSSASASPSF